MKMIYMLGHEISVDVARISYNKYRIMFQKEADRAKSEFYGLYQKNQSLDDVIKNVPGQIEQIINSKIDFCTNLLMQHNVLTLDATRFKNQYLEIQDIWAEPYLQLCDQYAEITMEQKALDEYRVARRQGRSRWRGGGFGLSGAMKGAATAGALNLVTGAGHMVFNGVGKLISSASANSKKRKIFSTPETYSKIAQGVWEATFALHYALIDCLKQYNVDVLPFEGAVSAEDAENATAILNNAKRIAQDTSCRAALIQSFQLNPYQTEWYLFVLDKFGDSDGSLARTAEYFGVSEVQQEKHRRLDTFAQGLPLSTEELAKVAESQVQDYKKQLHYFEDTPHTTAIKETVQRFDEEFRTVDGITFVSREEASKARAEAHAIDEVEATVNFESLDSIKNAEEKIARYTTPVAAQRKKNLREKWETLDKQLRTVSTLLPDGSSIRCKTYQQAESLKPIVEALKQRLDACGETDEVALSSFKSQLLTDNIPSALSRCYQTEIDRRLAVVDQKFRTTLGKEYSTRETARAAEQQYAKIKDAFRTGNPRKNGAKIKLDIENSDFSDATRNELLDELFQCENATELKTAKAFTRVSTVILLIIIVGSYFFSLSGTLSFASKDVTLWGVSLMVTDIEVVDDLTFIDGFKNGLVVFGRCFGDIFVEGFWEYIGGFGRGWIGNILWAILGFVWIVMKQCIIVLPRYLVSLTITFFQKGALLYYLGYIIGSAIPLAVTQFNFDEDTPEENVQRIKRWTAKKVFTACIVIALVFALTFYFIQK